MFTTIPEYVVAFFGAFVSGGVGLKIVEYLLGTRDKWQARLEAELARVETRYRGDLARLEERLKGYEERIGRLERESDEWQVKYYKELQERQMLEVALAAKDQLIDTLQSEIKKWEASASRVYRKLAKEQDDE